MHGSIKPLEFILLVLEDRKEIQIPIFGDDLLPDNCSAYARLSAKIMFGIEYPQAGSKTMRQQPNIGTIPVMNSTFPELVRAGTITPGMLVGIHFEKNRFNDGISPYMHLALYVGQAARTPLFIEQLGRHYRTLTIQDYDEQRFELREALHLKK